MSKPYYADIVRHFFRKANPTLMHDGFYATGILEKRCKACMAVLNTFSPEWRDAITQVYMHPEGVQEGVRRVCMEKLIPNSAMWSLINQYERKAARLIIIEEV